MGHGHDCSDRGDVVHGAAHGGADGGQHNLSIIFDGLKKETVNSLQSLQMTKEMLVNWSESFPTNR